MAKVINIFFDSYKYLSGSSNESPSMRERSFEYYESGGKGEDETLKKFQENAKTVIIMRAVQEAASDIERTASSTGQRYFNLTEDYMAENQMNLINANVNRAKSLGSDVYTGAKIGGTFGPIGAFVGAVVGVAKFSVDTAVETRNRSSQWYSALNATNAQTEFNQARMSYLDDGRGTEN